MSLEQPQLRAAVGRAPYHLRYQRFVSPLMLAEEALADLQVNHAGPARLDDLLPLAEKALGGW